MSQPLLKGEFENHLSVIHKSFAAVSKLPELQDPVFQTDLNFNLVYWNTTAELLYGKIDSLGKNIFTLIDVEFLDSSAAQLQKSLTKSGSWTGEILYRRIDGNQYYFRATATYLINKSNEPQSILVVCNNITESKRKESQLAAMERKYQILLNTLPEGVITIDATGKITTCNKRGAAILGLSEDTIVGSIVANSPWSAQKTDGSYFKIDEFPALITLRTGHSQRNVVMGIKHPLKGLIWVSINAEALVRPGEYTPYAVVVSFKDITTERKTEEELKRINERFYHVTKVTSDAIWDYDVEANTMYRSEAFAALSGYPQEEINKNMDWWFDHIHPEEQERVKEKVNQHIQQKKEKWQDEYRFQCADGSYKYLLDSGVIQYQHGKPVRFLGAIQDLTDQKKLENQLLEEHALKHQAITLATINAQEQEKTNISRELHDNVNQLLMSAKLFMDTARRMPAEAGMLIDKAIEYQLTAVNEIRKLSRSLNTSHIITVGLKESVQDIVTNLQVLQNIKVVFRFSEEADKLLQDEQKLTLFRIIQEQTSNILKHAAASEVFIGINKCGNVIQLRVTDNGVGFDTAVKKEQSIGLVNIKNRVVAHSGSVQITSSPGQGCRLVVDLPVQ
jgi:PAS domain S-box-containing protein